MDIFVHFFVYNFLGGIDEEINFNTSFIFTF